MADFSASGQGNNCPCNDDVIRTRDSKIEEVRTDRNTGFVTISYGVKGNNNITHMKLVTLIVGRETVIRDSNSRNIPVSELRKGMTVDAEFSSAMTASIPPQARAFRIIVVSRNSDSAFTVGRVWSVDLRNRFLYTGSPNDRLSQMRFVITDSTLLLDMNGNRIPLRDFRVGQRVRVEHATFQTQSIPPQTTAYVVKII